MLRSSRHKHTPGRSQTASAEQIKALLKSHGDGEDDRFFSVAMQVSGTVAKGVRWQRLADLAVGLSYAEITRASNEELKDALIHERPRGFARRISERCSRSAGGSPKGRKFGPGRRRPARLQA